MKRIFIISTLAVLFVVSSLFATVINIPADYPTIQQGIDASADGDTVLVQPGTYIENINFNGHNIVLGSLFLTTEDTTKITSTIIDGDSSDTVVRFSGFSSCNAALIGFTIQNGSAVGGGGVSCSVNSPKIKDNIFKWNSANNGAAIYLFGENRSIIKRNAFYENNAGTYGGGIYCAFNAPFIEDNVFVGNNAGECGGGLCLYESEAIVSNNRFIGNNSNSGGGLICIYSTPILCSNTFNDNSAQNGAGLYISTSEPTVKNNILYNNVAQQDGGGIKIYDSNCSLKNNILRYNIATLRGGGLFLDNSFSNITRNVFFANEANEGGGIFADYGAYPEIVNSIIYGNTAISGGGVAYLGSSYPQKIESSIIWGNIPSQIGGSSQSVQVYYSDIEGGWIGFGNINLEPHFRNLSSNDFHLMSTACGDPFNSPCIDTGHPAKLDSLLDCNFGLGTELCDMGLYGGGDYPVPGRIINVPADYIYIQQAIDACVNGDTVIVQPGTYLENINFAGKNIVLGSIFLTTNNYSYIFDTIIDGDSADNVVTIENGEDTSAEIVGFTIRNGFSTGGSGIKCSQSSPTIKYNYITGNSTPPNYGFGGGISCYYSNSTISKNIISDNFANYGAGVQMRYSHAIIKENVIEANTASNFAGGISIRNSMPTIVNNIIFENHSQRGGGLNFGSGSSSELIGNVIFNNTAIIKGGGIFQGGGSFTNLINVILWDNNAPVGSEIEIESGTLVSAYCDIQGGWPGQGNINIDPLFRDPVNFDFHLMSIACGDSADSPCIDAGDPNILDSLLDCSWGLGGQRSDMGAYGGGDSVTVAIFDDSPPLPAQFMLLQNYPNPFNAQTTIKFVLVEPQDVQLTVYDILGRQVEILLDEYKQAGVHAVTFDASHLSSGVYFYRLRAGEITETKRMLLIK